MDDQGIIKDRIEGILKELQTIISVFYILMVGIGMLFEYQKYMLFGINIFDYADVFDFLTAPFKSPLIFLFILISLFISYFALKSDVYMKGRWPKFYRYITFGMSTKSWYGTFRNFATLVIFILYIDISSILLANNFKEDFESDNGTIKITYIDDSSITGRSIGGTKEVLFILSENSVKIVPTGTTVKEIDLKFNAYKK